MFAPAGTPKELLETIFKASVQAMQAPSVQEVFKKQNFNVVPNASLDEAKIWLAGEVETWSKITNEVKIEVTD
jgi:tripartite-type tricarboxylate transporter receptor subunit TctC